jgi:hypothetical protein
MILFIDIDGVMHPTDCVDPADTRMFAQRWHLDAVVRVLKPKPTIVISSAWRIHRPLESIQRFFPEDIASLIVGKTPQFKGVMSSIPDHLYSFEREAECWSWLRGHDALAQPWLAIDDQPGRFRPFNRQVYAVDPNTGLLDSDVPKLLEVIHGLG